MFDWSNQAISAERTFNLPVFKGQTVVYNENHSPLARRENKHFPFPVPRSSLSCTVTTSTLSSHTSTRPARPPASTSPLGGSCSLSSTPRSTSPTTSSLTSTSWLPTSPSSSTISWTAASTKPTSPCSLTWRRNWASRPTSLATFLRTSTTSSGSS